MHWTILWEEDYKVSIMAGMQSVTDDCREKIVNKGESQLHDWL